MAANGMEQFKESTTEVLGYVEKLFSFASNFNPIFGIITKLVKGVRKGLEGDEAHKLYKDFQQINDKLESITEQNKQLQIAIISGEIEKNYGDLEMNIEEQYRAFKNFVDKVKKEPETAEHYREEFKNIVDTQKGRMNLNAYYRGIMGTQGPFERPLLDVYLEECKGDKKIMMARCDHLAYLFHIGLMALMASCVIIGDDVDQFQEEWGKKISDIQGKMQEALGKCDKQV